MRVFAAFIIAMSAFLGGCATNPFVPQDGTSTAYKQAQTPQSVAMATVVGTRDVKLIEQQAVLGERVGATVGGLIGIAFAKELTKSSSVQTAFGVLGGSIGMQAGKQSAGTVPGQELILKTDLGAVMTVAQSSVDGVRFSRGQRVMIIGGGRVAPAIE